MRGWPAVSFKLDSILATTTLLYFFLFSSFPSPRFFFFSFPFPSLLWFWSFSGSRNVSLDAFSRKWLQISLGWFSKNQLDIHVYCIILPINNLPFLQSSCFINFHRLLMVRGHVSHFPNTPSPLRKSIQPPPCMELYAIFFVYKSPNLSVLMSNRKEEH